MNKGFRFWVPWLALAAGAPVLAEDAITLRTETRAPITAVAISHGAASVRVNTVRSGDSFRGSSTVVVRAPLTAVGLPFFRSSISVGSR